MRLKALIPMLGVADVQRSVDFYCKTMGFQMGGSYAPEGRLCWASLQRDDVSLMLTLNESARTADGHRCGHNTILYFYPDDVESLHAELKGKDARVGDLRVTFHEMKEF